MRYSSFLLIILLSFHFSFCTEKQSQPSQQKTDVNLSLDYERLKENIQAFRQKMKVLYLQSQSTEEKEKLRQQVKSHLFSIFTDSLLPAWYGTPWDFNGMSHTPGKGAIACGSFVTFTLQDLGFKIPTRMLRQPAENIIKNLCSKKDIHHFPQSWSIKRIEQWFKQKGSGVYIVGLDIHVGFIIVKNDSVTFCHSSYYNPPLQVVNEPIATKNPFSNSHYKVIGKIFSDQMIEKWLLEQPFEMRYDYERRQ